MRVITPRFWWFTKSFRVRERRAGKPKKGGYQRGGGGVILPKMHAWRSGNRVGVGSGPAASEEEETCMGEWVLRRSLRFEVRKEYLRHLFFWLGGSPQDKSRVKPAW